nr:hypothetical protein [Tanacetum cinerariifolium]
MDKNEYNAVFEESKGTGKEAGKIQRHEDLNVGDYGEVYEVHDETVRFVACTSSKDDDNFDYCGLIEAQTVFANAYDISLRGQLR